MAEYDLHNSPFTGAQIDELLQKVANEDVGGGVFWAEYTKTPYQDVLTAYNAGKVCFAVRNNKTYYLGKLDTSYSPERIYFYAIPESPLVGVGSKLIAEAVCVSSEGWAYVTASPGECVDNKVQVITATASEHTYPTVAAVYDYVAPVAENADKASALAMGAYVTPSASGAVASFDDGADELPVKSLAVDIEPVQAGSGDPSPDNVRPISGWTGVNVQRTGKNLVCPGVSPRKPSSSKLNDVNYTFDADRGRVRFDIAGDIGTWKTYQNYYRLPAGTYTLTLNIESNYSSFNAGLFVRVDNINVIVINSPGHRVHSFTLEKESNVDLIFHISGSTAPNVEDYVEYESVQIEIGSTATDFKTYQGDTYSITFPTEAGTVYGGTLNVTTGLLTVDKAKILLNSLSYSMAESTATNARFISSIPGIKAPTDIRTTVNAICSTYPAGPWSWLDEPGHDIFFAARQRDNSMQFIIRNVAYATTEEFSASLSDADVLVYELATPLTYQLTPIEVNTLLGVNNVYSDTGDTEVTYRADPALIYNKLAAAIISSGGTV